MSARLFRRILSFAPKEFRLRYESELLETYEARERQAVREGRAGRFRMREMVGALRLVFSTRLGAAREPGLAGASYARGWPSALLQDVRFAVRTLRHNIGFSLTAVTVLALGIGATSAVFSAVNAYFFRALPFVEEERLVTLFETNPEFGWVDAEAAPANLFDWRGEVAAFDDVSGYIEFTDELVVQTDGEPSVVTGNRVMGNFFSTLGVAPALGRTFRMEETWEGQDAVVVLSHELWRSLFGGDPDILGRRLEFTNHAPEIIGVMPEGFTFPLRGTQLWYPMGWDPAARDEVWFRRAHLVRPVARLAPGVSLAEANAQLQVVVSRLQSAYPETNSVMGAGLQPMRDFLVKDVRTPLTVLLGAVAFLLLLACTNVANLMLVRASERTREVTLRRVLGASNTRLFRQMLAEGGLLALAGGVAGLALGWVALKAFNRAVPLGIDGATTAALDHRVVLFTLAAAVLSSLLFGVAPALRSVAGEAGSALRDGGRGSTTGRRGLRTAGALVSVQVALALILVVGAGLMVRSVWLLSRVDPGFTSEGVLAVQFAVQDARYPNRDDVLSFYDRFAEALEARPGIARVGIVGRLPLDGASWSSQFQANGWPPDRVGFEILHRRADTGYFEALGVPLLEGRMFDERDGPDAPLVVLINEAFAREHFPAEDPIGRRIAYDRNAGPESTWYEIVGVVGDQRQLSLSRPARAEVFEHRSQDWSRNTWHVVRGEGDASALVPTVRAVLRELDPSIPIADVRPLTSVRRESMAREHMVLTLLGAFGAVALLLASVGVYGVTSRAARRRTQEIGIRMALGARGRDVMGLMLRQGLIVVLAGLAVGVVASLIATPALASLLFGVQPSDPVTLAGMVLLLGATALLATYVPARRAMRVDPVTSLGSD